jgi:hypothetical protein
MVIPLEPVQEAARPTGFYLIFVLFMSISSLCAGVATGFPGAVGGCAGASLP